MNYKKNKEKLSEIRTKERQARQELEALKERQHSIGSEVQRAHDTYVQKQADEKAEQCTAKDVLKAEKAYLKLKDEADQIEEQISVNERLVSILKSKVQDLKSDFLKDAVPFHKEKLAPRFEKIQNALDSINSEIDYLNQYRMELQKDQVPDSVMNGITRHSKAVITTKNIGSIGFKDLITTIKK